MPASQAGRRRFEPGRPLIKKGLAIIASPFFAFRVSGFVFNIRSPPSGDSKVEPQMLSNEAEVLSLPNCSAGGCGRERVLRPRMLRIPSAELLSDLRIGVLPKTAEVLCYSEWPSGRREQVDGDRCCSSPDAGCFGQSKDLLQFYRKRWVTSYIVLNRDT